MSRLRDTFPFKRLSVVNIRQICRILLKKKKLLIINYAKIIFVELISNQVGKNNCYA
jgi:hypothetical protein